MRGVEPVTCVLFDLDGTLADTAPDLAQALNQLLLETDRAAIPFENIRPMVSHGGVYMICKSLNITTDDPDFPVFRERFLAIYELNLVQKTSLFPGIPDVLDQLESEGISWGIVTNKIERLTLPLVRALELADRAACVVCGDTVDRSKPHPAPMLHACALTGESPSRSLYIGDAEKDVMAGKNAGMRTLVAVYGYIGKQESPEDWGADGLISSPGEILDWMNEVKSEE